MSTRDKFAGFPWLSRYCQFHAKSSPPSTSALEDEMSKLDRYVSIKQRELDDVVAVRRQIEQNKLATMITPDDGTPAEMNPTLRMVFQRAEAQLLHDIKELKTERDMVHNALLELPWYEKAQQDKEKQETDDDFR